jgi:hypothetical protein
MMPRGFIFGSHYMSNGLALRPELRLSTSVLLIGSVWAVCLVGVIWLFRLAAKADSGGDR